jgi:hypothetical protein
MLYVIIKVDLPGNKRLARADTCETSEEQVKRVSKTTPHPHRYYTVNVCLKYPICRVLHLRYFKTEAIT